MANVRMLHYHKQGPLETELNWSKTIKNINVCESERKTKLIYCQNKVQSSTYKLSSQT